MEKWTMPNSFPDLSRAEGIAIDIETRDDDLKKKGPAVRRGGYIVGIGVITNDKQFMEYYPIAHDEGPNLNKSAVLNWLNDVLKNPDQPKIGANLLYDFDYLSHAGVKIGGDKWVDIQNAEPLINENAGSYSLNSLAKKYLGESKMEQELIDACAVRGLKGDPKGHIWQLPASIVGPYCIKDAELCLDIFSHQKKIMLNEGTYNLFKLESYLMPLLLYMRRMGVRIDVEKLDNSLKESRKTLFNYHKELKSLAGFDIEIWASASIAKAFKDLKLDYPLTQKTKKPSFTAGFLTDHPHELPRLILKCRKLDKFIKTFLEGAIKDQLINRRIHCSFNQQRAENDAVTGTRGTVTGRFSSSNPNLQQIPNRDPVLGPLCRSMFIPEENCLWGRADYSQIELRIFAHYAMGKGADAFRAQYINNPDIDFHQWCADLAGIDRRHAKDVNFGILYGMGVKRLGIQLGLPPEDAKELLKNHAERLPFMRSTSRAAMDVAENRGYVRTILNRRRRFDKWEPLDWNLAQVISSMNNPDALIKLIKKEISANPTKDYINGIKRAGTYKALNAVIQGSSADMLKMAMVNCWRSGIFKILTPHMTIHDELDVSIPNTKEGHEAFAEMVQIMETAIELKVPAKVDAQIGKSWGELSEVSESTSN